MNQAESQSSNSIIKKLTESPDLIMAGGVLGILAIMIVPMPPFVMDLLISAGLAVSVIMLVTSVYVKRALEFSSFPTMLLLITLYRLSLNVATTRVILLRGSEMGTSAAGQVIHAFGEFVVGGNYAVGIVVFAILVVINFVVITKGAGRVAEVSARFTLDALPGKQMSIGRARPAHPQPSNAKSRRELGEKTLGFRTRSSWRRGLCFSYSRVSYRRLGHSFLGFV